MMIREMTVTYRQSRADGPRPQFRSSAPVAEFARAHLYNGNPCGTPHETCYVLLLNAKHVYQGHAMVSMGTLDTAIVHPRDVFRPALVQSAAAIIVVHNHPSGNPIFSGEDRALCARLRAAGILLGIELLDFLAVCDDCHQSARDTGDIS